jgi:hypothetical protein
MKDEDTRTIALENRRQLQAMWAKFDSIDKRLWILIVAMSAIAGTDIASWIKSFAGSL